MSTKIVAGAAACITASGLAMAGSGSYTISTVQADGSGLPLTTHVLSIADNGLMTGQEGANHWHAFATDADGGVVGLHTWSDNWISKGESINEQGQVAINYGIPPSGDGSYTSYIARYTPGVGVEDLADAELGGPDESGQGVYDLHIAANGDIAATFWNGDFTTWHYSDATAWTNVGALIPGSADTEAVGITDDGAAIVLLKESPTSLWRYSPGSGMQRLVEKPGMFGIGNTVSNGDGVIAGRFEENNSSRAFRMVGDEFENIHDLLPGATSSSAKAVSSNGTVGGVFTADGQDHVFSYDGSTVTTAPLPIPDASVFVEGVSDDGVVIGAFFETYVGIGFVMNADGAVEQFQDIVDPNEDMFDAGGPAVINAGGTIVGGATVVGQAPNETVALVLTPTGPCTADLTGDGAIDAIDLNQILAAFGGSDAGDVDGDGDTDSTDLNTVLANFGETCGG